jgi:hypothetical protein
VNYEKRFLEIKSFLKDYYYLVDQEMLDRFEDEIPLPFSEWIVELSKLQENDLIELENNYQCSAIKNESLICFIKRAKDLIEVEEFTSSEVKLAPELTRKMSLKKRHEISRIKDLLKDEDISNFVDIGSGAGHLSSALVDDKRSSICIDANAEFQSIGKEKIRRWTPQLEGKLKFINKEIKTSKDIIMPEKEGMILGLHCCGALSTNIIKSLPPRVLSLGCCYHKLIDEYNISTLASESPLILSNHALTIAAKGHSWQTAKSFKNKKDVKKYRYTLHFLLLEKFNQSFTTLGNANSSDYKGEFSKYCFKFATQTKVLDNKTIESFYKDNINKVNMVIAAGTLRALVARVIEMYIILDRVIYLKEFGKNPRLIQIFDQKISPRNLAIYI